MEDTLTFMYAGARKAILISDLDINGLISYKKHLLKHAINLQAKKKLRMQIAVLTDFNKKLRTGFDYDITPINDSMMILTKRNA